MGQDLYTHLASRAVELMNRKSYRIAPDSVPSVLALFTSGNQVGQALYADVDRARRFATGEERIPLEFRAAIKPAYEPTGFVWLKGICAIFSAYVEHHETMLNQRFTTRPDIQT